MKSRRTRTEQVRALAVLTSPRLHRLLRLPLQAIRMVAAVVVVVVVWLLPLPRAVTAFRSPPRPQPEVDRRVVHRG